MTTKTQRLIQRIQEKESFYDVAYVCEDFETFEIEVAEWGVDHIAGVDFDDPEVNRGMMNAYFASFGCTPDNPHPARFTGNATLHCRKNRVRLYGLYGYNHRAGTGIYHG